MDSSFKGFYRGKKVLVTGHTGFKGAWLTIWLNELGADVLGYALDPPSDPNLFERCRIDARMTHRHADVNDFDALLHAVKEFRPDIVFHLAAQAIVLTSYEDPKSTFETNVLGTLNMLEAVRMTDCVRSLVLVTSDKCYENKEQLWGYKENDPMGGNDPYSASKGAAELVIRGYLTSFFAHGASPGVASVRAGNVVGGGDWARDRIVPDCVRSLAGNRPIEIRHPQAIRPWQHVLEPLGGYLWLGVRLAEDPVHFSGGWNFGPEESVAKSVRELVTRIIAEWGRGEWREAAPSERSPRPEAGWLRLSCEKARQYLHWSAILPFEETVGLSVRWYKHFYDRPDTNMYQYCVHQIREYADLARRKGQQWAL